MYKNKFVDEMEDILKRHKVIIKNKVNVLNKDMENLKKEGNKNLIYKKKKNFQKTIWKLKEDLLNDILKSMNLYIYKGYLDKEDDLINNLFVLYGDLYFGMTGKDKYDDIFNKILGIIGKEIRKRDMN